jgi:ATP-binding cassette subfamily B protein RaxB
MNVLDGLNLGWQRPLPVVLQIEAAECGLSCLAMVAGYFGAPFDAGSLRRRFGMSLKGATLRDVVRVANQLGFAARPLRLELAELPLLRTPAILHWDLNHFVVLKRVRGATAIIHDPAAGVRRLSFAELSRHFTGVALELTPTGGFEPAGRSMRVRLRPLLGRLVGIKSSLAHLIAIALAMEVLAMVSPLFLEWVVDHALVTGDDSLLQGLVLAFTLLLLMQAAVSAMRGWMVIVLGASLKVQARTNLFSHLLQLPASYFEMRHLGDIMSRFTSQETILRAITTELVVAILDGLMCAITLAIMLLFSPTLTALVIAGALLYAILRWTLYTPLRQASAENIVWAARRDSHFLETLRGIKTIKLFNGQDERRAQWLNLLVGTTNRQITTEKLQLAFRVGNALLLGGLGILVIWRGAVQVLANIFSVGMLVAFIAYKDQFLRRVSELIDKMVDLQMLRLHAERLGDIALTAPEANDYADGPLPVPSAVTVEARHLSFRYSSNDPLILDDVSFHIEGGESVAIVGPSGCGKTTLLKLLAGLLQPNSGEILVGGEPLTRIGLERYRAMIGVVMQDDQLFAGSIADNISFFAAQPDFERVVRCARMAAVHDDIVAMPMGYGTLIGDMGTVLSGGQKQRVLIARALYREPRLLLLDEATSHLDVEREDAVNGAVRAAQVTRIIIAHRPETIRSADRVIVLAHGKVIEDAGAGASPSYASPSAYMSGSAHEAHRRGSLADTARLRTGAEAKPGAIGRGHVMP